MILALLAADARFIGTAPCPRKGLPMRFTELDTGDAYLVQPEVFSDDRGAFLEIFRQAPFREGIGHALDVAQVNCSVSHRGTIRGVHGVAVPPGQARYITCVHGAVLDIVVDVRVGSPTFGRYAVVQLDDRTRHALYIAEGLGHGFAALSEQATVVYLCSSSYNPDREFRVHPFDVDLALPWPEDAKPTLSPKDSEGPSLRVAREQGLLPDYTTCRVHYDGLSS